MNETKFADEQDEALAARRHEIRRLFDRIYAEMGVERVSPDDIYLDVRPGETRAEAALRELQEGFAASDVSEEEFQEEGRRIREELYREYYGGE